MTIEAQTSQGGAGDGISHLLPLTAAGVAFVLISMLAITLWHLRATTLDSQARELKVLALTMSDEIYRSLQGVEVGMRAVGLELEQGRLATKGPNMSQSLRSRAGVMPMVQSLWLLDGEGRVLAASSDTHAPELPSFAFEPRQANTDSAFIGRPFTNRQGGQSVALAVPYASNNSGRVDGWIVAAISDNLLLGSFTAASQAPDARMAMFRSDGTRLAGGIVAAPTLDEASRAKRLASAKALELRRFRDGTERIVSISKLPRYPLVLMLTRDWDAVSATWLGFARAAVLGMLLIIAALSVSVYSIMRAARKQAQAHQALLTARSRTTRLESLGSLAGSVAHDFNNVLASIMGYAEMARDSAADGSRQARHLDHIIDGANRGKALVERILAFSRGGARTAVVFELEHVICELLELLAAALPSGIVVERRLNAPGARLRGDPTQIFEAIMNLCTNALQAMPHGGMLTLDLEREHAASPRQLSHTALPAGRYLVLRVSDQGGGITRDVMEHLFEPFFTTRGTQSGTGLGLAVVFGAVAEIKGAIDVESTPGSGACFTLYLPECFDALSPVDTPLNQTQRGSGETILVVDDEPELVGLSEESLRGLGYSPEGFIDPVAALKAFQEAPQRYAAVITDEMMPGLSGTELTRRLRELSPEVPVLLVSGYGGAALAERAESAGVTKVLSKPLRRATLALALAELLRASRPR